MSKLLARAKVNLENAKNSYSKMGIDDAYVDDCCYNLQQVIEKTLKYIVEMNGSRYAETFCLGAELKQMEESSNSRINNNDTKLLTR
ncbi:MAG: HEPN domain-containing protein [Lachnospiraceae bacterium]